jgi:hypothetical protein
MSETIGSTLVLGLTQVKDLDYICELAQHYMVLTQARTSVMPGERAWAERIARYRQIFAMEIQKVDNTPRT